MPPARRLRRRRLAPAAAAQSTEQLGKPQGQDLASGNLTAPTIFALQREPALRDLIETRFEDPSTLQRALSMIAMSDGIDAARDLAKREGCAPCRARRSAGGRA